MYVHKVLGAACLCNFIYRYGRLMVYGGMGFETPTGMYTILLHGLLSGSSLIFHIPFIRNVHKPTIYPEFRAHSILFAWRSVIVCILHYYRMHYAYVMLTCYATFFCADCISGYYNQEMLIHKTHGKTMRNIPYDDTIPEEERRKITRMHSELQIGATFYMLVNIDTAFSPLFAIQIAAFLMTLVRKEFIRSPITWHLLYSWSLWINYELLVEFLPGTLFAIRLLYYNHCVWFFHYRVNKYVAWLLNYAAFAVWRELGYERYVTEWTYAIVGREPWNVLVKLAIYWYYYQNIRKYWVLFTGTKVPFHSLDNEHHHGSK
jgi:hypothetical protein